MIGDLLWILALCCAGWGFWQQRHQAETARQAIQRHCTQLDLQLLNVAFGQHKFRTSQGAWGLHTVYLFEFSALGDDCYQGQLEMRGLRVGRFSLPPYRI
ncbi:DUF3301 domain-containing protein [Vibrio sp. dsl-7]|uniref:DUF3301 domain-containing protein n=1 Tax=Vibrio chanodichtyis TaxID=3027932 RepID=A0ABT5V2G0_9VIBR|nr:DUF3301 domain-containing protein [Vibrio chanodichtyis]MDE1515845.1 DUF3301 domain-containing protein [Vibrio chanodichtyis]